MIFNIHQQWHLLNNNSFIFCSTLKRKKSEGVFWDGFWKTTTICFQKIALLFIFVQGRKKDWNKMFIDFCLLFDLQTLWTLHLSYQSFGRIVYHAAVIMMKIYVIMFWFYCHSLISPYFWLLYYNITTLLTLYINIIINY